MFLIDLFQDSGKKSWIQERSFCPIQTQWFADIKYPRKILAIIKN